MIYLDDLDRAILKVLKEDARITISEISEKLGKPESTIHFRIKKLIEKGIVEKYTIVLGEVARPKEVAFVVIGIEKPVIEDFLGRYLEYVSRNLANLPNILLVAKTEDEKIVALVGAETKNELNEFIEENIKTIPSVREVVVYPITEFKKGEEIKGLLLGI
ncbi:Lrp/AsnC family transcriptional regulator [Thermococcus bergensis]|uniref:Lrp/AsnC family transcriptional regulator n=1 Tax=Thermococcus bergensis TaxID=2689387 RepID=UPI001CEC66A0|nr:Lrp/AsnC family transcriptional regulator [Thermococcus bergensis]MCA6212863.1 Lrp/AsnC family transcriptional regulator [Thermococcus bergensis]